MTTNFLSRRLIRWVAIAMLMMVSPLALLTARPVYAQTSPVVPIEIQGAITALTATTLTVNGLTIDISTAQVRGTLAVGTLVKVEGNLQADGTVKARQVKVVTDATAPQESQLTGIVDSITGDVMVISGQSFNTASAEIGTGVVVGARVKVHFTVVAGSFVAREVKLAAAPRDRAHENELTGAVDSITGDVMVVSGQSFNTASAEIGAGVVVGAQVKVHYTVVDGVNVAREVRLVTDTGRDDTPRGRGGDDGAGHDAGDDHGGHGGDDGAGHDAGDDHGGRGSGGDQGGHDGSGHR